MSVELLGKFRQLFKREALNPQTQTIFSGPVLTNIASRLNIKDALALLTSCRIFKINYCDNNEKLSEIFSDRIIFPRNIINLNKDVIISSLCAQHIQAASPLHANMDSKPENNELFINTWPVLARKFEVQFAELRERCDLLRGPSHCDGEVDRAWRERVQAKANFDSTMAELMHLTKWSHDEKMPLEDILLTDRELQTIADAHSRCVQAHYELGAKDAAYIKLDRELRVIYFAMNKINEDRLAMTK